MVGAGVSVVGLSEAALAIAVDDRGAAEELRQNSEGYRGQRVRQRVGRRGAKKQ